MEDAKWHDKILFLTAFAIITLIIVMNSRKPKKPYDPWSHQYKLQIYDCTTGESKIVYYYGDSDPEIRTFARAVPKLVTIGKDYYNVCRFDIIWRYNVRKADETLSNTQRR